MLVCIWFSIAAWSDRCLKEASVSTWYHNLVACTRTTYRHKLLLPTWPRFFYTLGVFLCGINVYSYSCHLTAASDWLHTLLYPSCFCLAFCQQMEISKNIYNRKLKLITYWWHLCSSFRPEFALGCILTLNGLIQRSYIMHLNINKVHTLRHKYRSNLICYLNFHLQKQNYLKKC